MDFYGLFEYLLWGIFLLFCLSFNYKQTHWLNLVTMGSLCAILWFTYPEDIPSSQLALISLIGLAIYVILQHRFNLNRYLLGSWGCHFLQFLRKPSFQHQKLSAVESVQLISHFLIIKLFITIVLLLPIQELARDFLKIDWQSAKNIPTMLSLQAIGAFVASALWEELQFRAAFRRSRLNVLLYLLIVFVTFGISFYSFSFFLVAICCLAIFTEKWDYYYVKYRFIVVYGAAIFFGLIHHNGEFGWFDLFGYLAQIFAGLCYIWLRVRYGLWYSILTHCGYNLLLFSLYT
ncbi:MAG: CPBP family glutamic-type intramembrane protease [Pasteurellaceae bacterium]|nr:CPBP family glutamic-type intramembrane protease [Pasteurellaceae bacterium]